MGLGSVSALGQQMDCYVQRLPGAQLFTLREALAADPDAALAELAATGVQEVELFGLGGEQSLFGAPIAEFRVLLDKHGLEMSCAHIGADNLNVRAVSRNARALGIDSVILGAPAGFIQPGEDGLRIQGPQTIEELDRLAEQLNSLGRQFRTEGLFFAYHNHHVEFIPVAGEIPYDYIMWNTDPQLVKSELDIGWIALAGADYLDILDRFGNRTIACHLKDFNGIKPRDNDDFLAAASRLVTPGSGVVNFKAVLEKMDYFGIRHGFIEIDVAEQAISSIARGHRHLQSLRDC